MAVPPQKNPRATGSRSAGLLLAVPALLIVTPLVGAFVGGLLDRRFGTSPWLLGLGLVLGFVAAGRETHRLVLRSQQEEEKERRP